MPREGILSTNLNEEASFAATRGISWSETNLNNFSASSIFCLKNFIFRTLLKIWNFSWHATKASEKLFRNALVLVALLNFWLELKETQCPFFCIEDYCLLHQTWKHSFENLEYVPKKFLCIRHRFELEFCQHDGE